MKRMRDHLALVPAAALVLAALLAVPALAEDTETPAPDSTAAPETAPDMAAAMEAMQKAAAPGEHHAFLAGMEGDWTYTSQVWMDPSQPPMKSGGTSKKTMIFGGRYLQEETTGEMMGSTFSGRATTGYDNTAGEFVSTWIDDMSTGTAVARGHRDGNTLTMHGEYLDPMSGQLMKVRQVTRVVDKDNHVFEYHMAMPGGPEFKSMEIEYTRK